jgi:hypothetical protein
MSLAPNFENVPIKLLGISFEKERMRMWRVRREQNAARGRATRAAARRDGVL